MKRLVFLITLSTLFSLFFVGCGSSDATEITPLTAPLCPTPQVTANVISPETCDDSSSLSGHVPVKLNSILWMQTSAEYQMAAEQSYMLARVMLDRGLADTSWTAAVEQTGNYTQLPPAIIMDVDETVLDNSSYQARLEKAGTNFDNELWDQWVREMKALAVPGALEFLQYAHDEGVMIFYMTNRSYEHEQATRGNLEKLGFPLDDQVDTLLTKGEQEDWISDKTSRRSLLAKQYRIILLIGDDPNDFVAGTKDVSVEQRYETLNSYHDYWGEKWIAMPNPIYGGWESALYDSNFDLSNEEIVKIKFEWLDTLE